MIKSNFRFFCVFIFLLFSMPIFAVNKVTFDSGEHVYIGNDAKVYYPVKVGDSYQYQTILGKQIDFRQWVLPGLKAPLSFGQIVAAPDLFADTQYTISDGKTFADRRMRFNRCFNDFVHSSHTTLDNVYAVMQEEVDMIKDAIANHIQPSEAYAEKGYYFVKKYFLADPDTAKYLLLGWDHFEKYARISYQAGHAEAIADAVQAHNAKDVDSQHQLLSLAYAKEAYSEHFLTDSFAAGHMRTPDKEIGEVMESNIPSQAVAAVIAILMHNEDNLYGVQLTNARGDHWTAYGDTKYLDSANAQNKKIIGEAVQMSINEITQAFKTGTEIKPENYSAMQLLPNLDQLDDYLHYVDSKNKSVPMFVWDAKSNDVLRRKNLNVLEPKTLPISSSLMIHHGGLKGWWGLTTLLELEIHYHPELAATINSKNVSELTQSNGKLTNDGMNLLVKLLSPPEKEIFCADPHTGKVFRDYLQCDSIWG